MTDSHEDARRLRLAAMAAEDAMAILALLPTATAVQWDRSKAGMGERDESGRRATGGHSDPTADTAADPARLYLRDVLRRADGNLTDAATWLRGVRRGLERALDRWEGPETAPVDLPES